jgi:uncharacterized phage protein (TIGR02218 family)
MKNFPDGLQAHLDSGATTLCWCWRLTRGDGTVHGFTGHDRDLAFDGTLFEASSGFTGSDIAQSVGLTVDNLDVAGALSSGTLSETDLASGLFDDAGVEIWRVNWAALDQRVLMMRGSIGEVRRAEAAFTAELRSLAHYLGQEKGRVYQYACDADLGDRRCCVNISDPAYTATGAVTSASSPHAFTARGLETFADGWFTGGLITWTSGANAGRAMEVKRHVPAPAGNIALAAFELWRSMASPITSDDEFTIAAGCAKTFTTCKEKFANQLNFRGFPHIPGNSYVLASPSPGDPANNGGSISS